MSDFARLENVLAKLRQREKAPGETRKLRGTGDEALMASLVAEIDETILPRRLIFTTDTRSEIHLAVANRRLQAVLSPVPDLPGASEIADVALGDGKDPNTVAVGDVLRDVFSKATTVSIAARPKAIGFGADVGAPSGGLAAAWGVKVVEARKKEPGEILGAFLETIGDADAHAWLRIEGEDVTDQAGDAERLAELGEQAAVFLDGYFGKFDALFPRDGAAAATLVSPGAAGDCAVLFVEIGTVSAFVVAKCDRAAALATIWQSHVVE